MANDSNSGGISSIGLLGVVFVALKLSKVIDWSWWWVTCPFWGGLVLFIIGLIFTFMYLGFKESKRKYIAPKKSRFQQRLDEYMIKKDLTKEDK